MRALEALKPKAPQALALGLFLAGIALAAMALGVSDWRMGALAVIGALLGLALYHGAFGFTAAYRRAMVGRDMGAVRAQIVMLALAAVLFAPVLGAGEAFGGRVFGAVAPADLRVAAGAFLFGIGMQIAGGCASGTLFTLGGGSLRMMLVLAAFCGGGFWATFHLAFWNALPSLGFVAFDRSLGWAGALALTLALLAALWLAAGRLGRGRQTPILEPGAGGARRLLAGPWPLIWAALALAILNFATLLVAGHPWSVTWGLTLWAAKLAALLGWVPEPGSFWAGGFPARALAAPLARDTVSVMNLAIVMGAGVAAAAAGRFRPGIDWRWGPVVAAVLGGLMLGYGARLAYGCNIGAFFSGVASQSLHGWIWIAAALPGTWLGIRLRPIFGLDDGGLEASARETA
ncbi:MAG: YeeE/YedE family protein [Alphaproteobacteria bacterium]|nr:YeeE/YedE family protein [Alphaproteobacteria bacterium]